MPELKLPRPHSKLQYDMITDPCSSVNFCGRQFGKTAAGISRLMNFGVKDPGLYWWVGESWQSASMKRAWRYLKYWTRQLWAAAYPDKDFTTGAGKNEEFIKDSVHEAYWPNGTVIWARTAERPESLVGEGIKGFVGDEFTLWKPEVWQEYLEATTLVHSAWAFFVGIPKGEGNWGCELFRSVQRGERTGWKARQAPTRINPFIKPDRLNDIRRTTSAWLFAQEYEAEIVKGVGAAFPPDVVVAAMTGPPTQRSFDPKQQYCAFVDAAGGGANEMTLSIFHQEKKDTGPLFVQDVLLGEIAARPEETVERFVAKLREFGIRSVTGDAYAGEWPREQFNKRGVTYYVSAKHRSDLYCEFQPLVMQGPERVSLLTSDLLKRQLAALVQRQSTKGRVEIVKCPGENDDRANVTAGACICAQDVMVPDLSDAAFDFSKRPFAPGTPQRQNRVADPLQTGRRDPFAEFAAEEALNENADYPEESPLPRRLATRIDMRVR